MPKKMLISADPVDRPTGDTMIRVILLELTPDETQDLARLIETLVHSSVGADRVVAVDVFVNAR